MKTVYKYELKLEDWFQLLLPTKFKILHVGEQNGRIYMWAEVDTKRTEDAYRFFCVGTGNSMPNCKVEHIGTVVMNYTIRLAFLFGYFKRNLNFS